MNGKTVLLIGASRGLGLGLAREYLARGWRVIATVRNAKNARDLEALAASNAGRLRIEALDVTDTATAAALARSLSGTTLDLLFVVAGMNAHSDKPIQAVSPQDASHEFLTNTYGPPATAEAFMSLVAQGGTIAFMTSVLGSIAKNYGRFELYRATKAGLNMLGSCFAQRHKEHPVLLLHPGWVRTDMGGPNGEIDVETSVRGLADTIASRAKPGIQYLDYTGESLPW